MVFTERYFSPQGRGRIGWQKSIFRGEPIHTETGEVYRDLYRTVVRVDPYHEFVNLHMYICHWIGQHLFGEELDDSLDIDTPIPSNAFDLLDKYEGQLYQDRHLEVYHHLRVWCAFLSGNYNWLARSRFNEWRFCTVSISMGVAVATNFGTEAR